jgi:hypothetical protein
MTDHRVKYMSDLIEDCIKAMDQHEPEQAFVHPQDRANVIAAMIILDGANGIRKTLKE